MRFLVAAAMFVLGLPLSGLAAACMPAPVTVDRVAELLAHSDHVFRGAVAETAPEPSDAATGRVRFGIERTYKGAPAAGEWHRYVKFSTQHCFGWTPSAGQRGIFFVYRHQGASWATLMWGLGENEAMLEEALRRTRQKSR
jgi:hypothetical protein